VVDFHESFNVTGLDVSFEVNELPRRLKAELDRASAAGSILTGEDLKR